MDLCVIPFGAVLFDELMVAEAESVRLSAAGSICMVGDVRLAEARRAARGREGGQSELHEGKDIPKIRNMRGITQEMMEVRKNRWIRSGEDCRDGRSWMWSMEGGPKEFWGLFMNLSSLPASIIIKLIQ